MLIYSLTHISLTHMSIVTHSLTREMIINTRWTYSILYAHSHTFTYAIYSCHKNMLTHLLAFQHTHTLLDSEKFTLTHKHIYICSHIDLETYTQPLASSHHRHAYSVHEHSNIYGHANKLTHKDEHTQIPTNLHTVKHSSLNRLTQILSFTYSHNYTWYHIHSKYALTR